MTYPETLGRLPFHHFTSPTTSQNFPALAIAVRPFTICSPGALRIGFCHKRGGRVVMDQNEGSIDMFLFWRLIFCSAKVVWSCLYTLRRAKYDHESRKWGICLNHYWGDPEETEIEKRCWIGVTGTWCKTWLWLGNAKVKCLDAGTLNSPCVIVVSPEFPILVQFVITKLWVDFKGMSRRMYTTHPPHSVATWLFFTLRYLIHWRIICPVCPPRSSLWDNGTRHTIRLGLHGMLPCPSKYISGMYGWAHTLGLYISTSQYSHLPWLPKQWNVVGWTETFLDFFHINGLRISVSWEHSEETATLGGAPWSRQLKRHRSIALSGWLVGLGCKWSSLSFFSMLWAFGCKKSMYLYTIVSIYNS